MKSIFDSHNRVVVEREFWITVLEAQIEAGLAVDSAVVEDYRTHIGSVDLDSIREREMCLKHDIPARLQEFNDLAGHQELHKAMTSRDLTENVELILIRQALELVDQRAVSLVARLVEKMVEHESLTLTARTHNVPAQPTTFGKRLAQVIEELMDARQHLRSVIDAVKFRGIKGPVGSMQDQINLLGSEDRAIQVEKAVAEKFGFTQIVEAIGQVYPRSNDFAVSSSLVRLGSAPSNFATTLRLMAGSDLASEGFGKNQIGSSAMPHKMNARSCERINGLFQVLRGYNSMIESLAGTQWNEGDVSCSVVRRVANPNLFLSLDGLFETTFAVVRGLQLFPAVINAELEKYLPFLSTTTLLVHAVQSGLGREDAHELIKGHAVETALAMRERGGSGTDLIERLASDPAFPGDKTEIAKVVESSADLLGAIPTQIESIRNRANVMVEDIGAAASYSGAEIL